MLSLVELRRAAPALEALIGGHRVQAIFQPDPTSVVITTYGGKEAGRRHVRFCCGPGVARVSQLRETPPALPNPPAFAQYLRKHVGRATVGGARLIEGDRQLALRLSTADGDYDLLLAIFGPRSNLYLLHAHGRIAASLRPLSETRPELELNVPWRSPESRPPVEGQDRFAEQPDDRLLLAIESHYAGAEESHARDELQRRIEQALRKEARALDRKLAKLDETLAEARDLADLQRQGELLKSVLSQVKRGQSEVVADDFETGEPVTISLDPKLSPQENLDRMFKRYRKALRSLTKSGARQDSVREARDELSALQQRLDALLAGEPELDALSELAAEDSVARLVRKYAPGTPAAGAGKPSEPKLGKQKVPQKFMPRRYRTAGDLEIWVGRSAAANDYLSLRLARGRDLFFHLDGAPGSHVILRTEGRDDPPSDAILDACELAVHYSKQKNATRADVHAVPCSNVRKPKGAKPGLVSVHGGKTIHLRRTEARLKRILDSRIED